MHLQEEKMSVSMNHDGIIAPDGLPGKARDASVYYPSRKYQVSAIAHCERTS